jgi:hypothetical protein
MYSTFSTLDYSLDRVKNELKTIDGNYRHPMLSLNEHAFFVAFPDKGHQLDTPTGRCEGSYKYLFFRVWNDKDLHIGEKATSLIVNGYENIGIAEIRNIKRRDSKSEALTLSALPKHSYDEIYSRIVAGKSSYADAEKANSFEIEFSEPIDCASASIDITFNITDDLGNKYINTVYFSSISFTHLNR